MGFNLAFKGLITYFNGHTGYTMSIKEVLRLILTKHYFFN